MKKGLLYLLCVFGIIALSSCTKADNRDKISVTIVPEEAFVKAISSEYFNVITIVPPQSSPETYEPSPIVMQDFQNSKIYFAIGVPTEKAHILSNVSKDTTVIHLENEVGELRKFENGETDPSIIGRGSRDFSGGSGEGFCLLAGILTTLRGGNFRRG